MTPNQHQVADKLFQASIPIAAAVIARMDLNVVTADQVAAYSMDVVLGCMYKASVQFAPPPTILPFTPTQNPK